MPAHVFGNGLETEHISVILKDFLPVLHQAGETGLIDLRIGEEKVRPVMIRDLQHDPLKGNLLHVDFYQVNLKEKVRVPVPVVLRELEEEIESVKMGEAVVLQTLNEVEVEALPTDLVEHIEVDISSLKNIDDAITVADLSYDREKLTILAEPEEVVVKLAPAVTEEMQQLLEEQEAEAQAAGAAAEAEEGKQEGEEVKEAEGEEGEIQEGVEPAEQEANKDQTPK